MTLRLAKGDGKKPDDSTTAKHDYSRSASHTKLSQIHHLSKEQHMLQRTEIRATGHVVNETKDLIVRQIGKGRKKSKVLNFSLAVNQLYSETSNARKAYRQLLPGLGLE